MKKNDNIMDGQGETEDGRDDDGAIEKGSPFKYRLPFGLCKKFGINIQDWWTPTDAWNALKGYNVSPDKAYDIIEKKGSTDSIAEDLNVELKKEHSYEELSQTETFEKELKEEANPKDDPYSAERKNSAIWCKSGAEALKKFAPKSNEIYNAAPESEKKAAWAYTAGSGKFNRPLRGYEGAWGKQYYKGAGNVDLDYEGAGKDIEELTKLIDKSSFDEDIWVQRGVNFDGAKALTKQFGKWDEKVIQGLVGKEIPDPAFMSCGAAKGTGFSGDVIFNIYIAQKGLR